MLRLCVSDDGVMVCCRLRDEGSPHGRCTVLDTAGVDSPAPLAAGQYCTGRFYWAGSGGMV